MKAKRKDASDASIWRCLPPAPPFPYYGQPAPSYGTAQQLGVTKVDGADEAMSRFLIKYGNQLVPGFSSEPLFDVNGSQFYTLSVEPDGRATAPWATPTTCPPSATCS